MTKTVFLDALNDVVAESRHEAPLAKAQAKNAEIVTAIANAPDNVYYRGSGAGRYHRLVNGDGTNIADYAEIPELEPIVAQRSRIIDRHTEKLLELGTFEYPSASGNFFSLNNLSVRIIQQALNAPVYPVVVPLARGAGTFTLANNADAVALAQAAFTATDAIVQSGESLKADLRAAPTLQLLLLITDPRCTEAGGGTRTRNPLLTRETLFR